MFFFLMEYIRQLEVSRTDFVFNWMKWATSFYTFDFIVHFLVMVFMKKRVTKGEERWIRWLLQEQIQQLSCKACPPKAHQHC